MSAQFDEFVNRHGSELLRLAYMLCGSRDQAEDLVQDALVKCYRKWDLVENADVPEAYVRTVVVRTHLSWWRRKSSRESPGEIPDELVAGHESSIANRDAAWRLLGSLPRKQRAVLVLRYYEDLPDADIAQLLNCTEGTVRSNAARALARLRTAVDAPRRVGIDDAN